MTDSATDWKVIIFANGCAYLENALDKWYSFVLNVSLGKVHVENEGCF